MSRLTCQSWYRPALIAAFCAGIVLVSAGTWQAVAWIEQGELVAEANQPLLGQPPWTTTLEVPQPGQRFLLELAVVVAAPARRNQALTITPTVDLTDPAGRSVSPDLQPTGDARVTWHDGRAKVTRYAWWTPASGGPYQVTLSSLAVEPTGLQPDHWSLRLAADCPDEPGGRERLAVGFVLAALALLLYVQAAGQPGRLAMTISSPG